MRVSCDLFKCEKALADRGLAFEDAGAVFDGLTVEVEELARTMAKSGSSVTAYLPDAWWLLATPRVARCVTFLVFDKANDREQTRLAPYFGL